MLSKQELMDLLPDLLKGMQIPLFLLDQHYQILGYCEDFFPLPYDYFTEKLQQLHMTGCKSYSLFRKSEMYTLFPVEIEDIRILCAGPYLYLKPSRNSSLTSIQFFSDLGITALPDGELGKVPYVDTTMNRRLRILYQLVTGDRLNEEDMKKSYQKERNTSPGVMHQMEDELYHQREDDSSILSFHLEKQLLDHVKKANSSAARSIYNELVHRGSVHTLSKNPVKSAQFSFVAMITLLTRAVIEAGVPEVHAYTMSDVYIKKVDDAYGIDQIHLMSNDAILDFTRLVKTHKNKTDPKWIRTCKEYIDEHLHEDIPLALLANQVHMNPSYLSVQFKKLTKQSIKAYTNQQKVKEASFLLRNSDLSLQDIAFSLRFGSENYFAKVFKAHTGTLPSQYRNT